MAFSTVAGGAAEVWRTDDVAESDRVDYYQYCLTSMSVPLELRIRDVAGFGAETQSSLVGTMDFKRVRQTMRGESTHYRTVRQIRRADPEAHRLMLVLSGRNRMSQAGWDVALEPGDMAVYDTSRPWEVWRDRGTHRFVTVTLARDALPIAPERVRELCGARISGQTGVGALVSTFVSRLAADLDYYGPASTTGLSNVLLDLLAVLLGNVLDLPDSRIDGHQRRVAVFRAQSYIQQHLADTRLAPAAVAAAQHLSLRTLQKAFQEQGLTVAGYIRTARLERCCRDLADPNLQHLPVYAIGNRCGFPDAAHFSRVFRAFVGQSPHDYRESHPTQLG
jgi:AraC-like DNA-binding protein